MTSTAVPVVSAVQRYTFRKGGKKKCVKKKGVIKAKQNNML